VLISSIRPSISKSRGFCTVATSEAALCTQLWHPTRAGLSLLQVCVDAPAELRCRLSCQLRGWSRRPEASDGFFFTSDSKLLLHHRGNLINCFRRLDNWVEGRIRAMTVIASAGDEGVVGASAGRWGGVSLASAWVRLDWQYPK